MFSRPVRSPSAVDSWKITPIRRLTASGSWLTSRPSTTALPEVGRRPADSIETVVVLPAPLGPRNPKISPRFTWKETPSTARTVPL